MSYLRFISDPSNRRNAVLASLASLRSELYARQAKRARHQAGGVEEEVGDEEVLDEQAGVLRGALAFRYYPAGACGGGGGGGGRARGVRLWKMWCD